MSQKAINITGWVLTAVLGLLLGFSAFMKITQEETAVAQAASIGIDAANYQMIGFIEIISLILFIIPRTGVLGTLSLIAYLGGAIVAHLSNQQPFIMPVVIQALVWITAILRFPALKAALIPLNK